MFTVWTIAYNRDGSVNNETLEGEFNNKAEAIALAKRLDGEVREHDTLESMYDYGYSIIKEDTRIKDLREITGMSAQRFGDLYGIPLRTIQNWEGNVNTPPEYVVKLLERVVREDFGE